MTRRVLKCTYLRRADYESRERTETILGFKNGLMRRFTKDDGLVTRDLTLLGFSFSVSLSLNRDVVRQF